jgi:hypothetical protein
MTSTLMTVGVGLQTLIDVTVLDDIEHVMACRGPHNRDTDTECSTSPRSSMMRALPAPIRDLLR